MKSLYLGLVLILFLAPKRQAPIKVLSSSKGTNPALAFTIGHKKSLSPTFKAQIKGLGISHLMTPSGLHLSSLILITSFFSKAISLKRLCFILSLLASFYWPHLMSIKRMSFFGLLLLSKRVNPKIAFFSTFLFDYIIGGWDRSSLSFSFSFLFLGLFIFFQNEKKRKMAFFILLGQALISYKLDQTFYPIGSVFGLFITALFPIIFPFFILQSLLPFISFPIAVFQSCIEFFYSFRGGAISPLFFLLASLFFIVKPAKMFIPLILLLFPSVLYLQTSRSFPGPPPPNWTTMIRKKWGYQFSYPNQMICRRRIKVDQWSTRCRR